MHILQRPSGVRWFLQIRQFVYRASAAVPRAKVFALLFVGPGLDWRVCSRPEIIVLAVVLNQMLAHPAGTAVWMGYLWRPCMEIMMLNLRQMTSCLLPFAFPLQKRKGNNSLSCSVILVSWFFCFLFLKLTKTLRWTKIISCISVLWFQVLPYWRQPILCQFDLSHSLRNLSLIAVPLSVFVQISFVDSPPPDQDDANYQAYRRFISLENCSNECLNFLAVAYCLLKGTSAGTTWLYIPFASQLLSPKTLVYVNSFC